MDDRLGKDRIVRLYATVFDSKYMPQAITLYKSLRRHSSEPFTLYALCLDQDAFDFLVTGPFDRIKPVSHTMFSTPVLEEIRRERDVGEYAWTCASNFLRYLAIKESSAWETHGLITYLDADCFFFCDPKICFDEMGGASVAVVPHRLPEHEEGRLGGNGKFNISWVTFRADDIGRKALWWWSAQTIEWCGRGEKDRSKFQYCGDQGYADAFPGMCGDALHVFQSPGIGLGPWSFSGIEVGPGPTVNGQEIVFFHAHEWRSKEKRSGYTLSESIIRNIYGPYEAEVAQCACA